LYTCPAASATVSKKGFPTNALYPRLIANIGRCHTSGVDLVIMPSQFCSVEKPDVSIMMYISQLARQHLYQVLLARRELVPIPTAVNYQDRHCCIWYRIL